MRRNRFFSTGQLNNASIVAPFSLATSPYLTGCPLACHRWARFGHPCLCIDKDSGMSHSRNAALEGMDSTLVVVLAGSLESEPVSHPWSKYVDIVRWYHRRERHFHLSPRMFPLANHRSAEFAPRDLQSSAACALTFALFSQRGSGGIGLSHSMQLLQSVHRKRRTQFSQKLARCWRLLLLRICWVLWESPGRIS